MLALELQYDLCHIMLILLQARSDSTGPPKRSDGKSSSNGTDKKSDDKKRERTTSTSADDKKEESSMCFYFFSVSLEQFHDYVRNVNILSL